MTKLNDDIKIYVDKNKFKGKQELRKELLSVGWKESVVDQHLEDLFSESNSISNDIPRPYNTTVSGSSAWSLIMYIINSISMIVIMSTLVTTIFRLSELYFLDQSNRHYGSNTLTQLISILFVSVSIFSITLIINNRLYIYAANKINQHIMKLMNYIILVSGFIIFLIVSTIFLNNLLTLDITSQTIFNTVLSVLIIAGVYWYYYRQIQERNTLRTNRLYLIGTSLLVFWL